MDVEALVPYRLSYVSVISQISKQWIGYLLGHLHVPWCFCILLLAEEGLLLLEEEWLRVPEANCLLVEQDYILSSGRASISRRRRYVIQKKKNILFWKRGSSFSGRRRYSATCGVLLLDCCDI
jgi:hypothetical protein